MLAPIILFVYNRPEHTQRTIEALQNNELASESVLYVFADGPKVDATKEQLDKIDEVRRLIHSFKGFKDVIIEESDKNKGLANSVIAGVTKVINHYGKVIVVEDDIITHKYFLRFMNEGLTFYKNNNRIFSIGGFTDNIKFPKGYNQDIFLSSRFECWGWSTWENRWQTINWDVTTYPIFKRRKKTEIALLCQGGDDLWPMLQQQFSGNINSWAIRAQYNMALQNRYCLRPVFSLDNNIGLDGTGVHCTENSDESIVSTPLYNKADYKIGWNAEIKVEDKIAEALKNHFKIHKQKKSYYDKIINIIKSIVK